ncbi:MAG: class II aldolase/adducin family protein [Deltaproteobacteria bacterium]|nr:class II aldolase/adducin family protein [Deltaproteobacteria bacterium]
MDKKIQDILSFFSLTGHQLLLSGMNSSHSGNLSVIDGEHIYITRSGTMLGHINDGDIIKADCTDSNPPKASMEYPVHRQIYIDTAFNAVIHCHPPYATALSLSNDEIEPLDMEGKRIVQLVPVVRGEDNIPDLVSAQCQKGHRGVMVKGHGVFVAADSMEEALHVVTAMEMSAKIISLSR